MSSVREQALAALFAAINAGVLGQARREDGNAGSVPSTGALITMGDGGVDADPILSPLQYEMTHSVPISVEAKDRASVDGALQGIAAAIAADPFLGGLVDWAEVGGPDVEAEAPTAPSGQQLPRLHTAQVTVTLTYLAPTPVG